MIVKIPQNLKYKKYNKKFNYGKGAEHKVSELFLGACCGLVALESGFFTAQQLKTVVQLFNKTMKTKKKKKLKFFFCVFFG
jgi:ribosomal protein L16/L10AE